METYIILEHFSESEITIKALLEIFMFLEINLQMDQLLRFGRINKIKMILGRETLILSM